MTTAVPALLPGACVAALSFQAGGFYPDSWALLALVLAVALAVRLTTVDAPFAGMSAWSGVAAAALALLGAWTLASGLWSDAPGRAHVEFVRLLAYLLIFVLCASLAPRERRLSWAIRGVALAIAAVCVAALVSRLRPDLISEAGLIPSRLGYPITYWNGLGLLAGVGVVLGLHLSASEREPWPARVLAAGLVPLAACTVYFTLSRGGIAATGLALVAYLVLGSSRATPAALLAIVPPTALALVRAYDADLLVTSDFGSPAGMEQGRDVQTAVLIAIGAAVLLRAAAIPIDRLLARVPSPGRLPLGLRAGVPAAVVVATVVAAVAGGAPGYLDRQFDAFLDSTPVAAGTDVRQRLTSVNNNGRVEHWKVAHDAWGEAPLRGTGAGTFQNLWNRDRDVPFQVVDAHSLYLETLAELGVVGLALLGVALLAVAVGLVVRLRGPDRPAVAAVLAAALAWAVHAGIDWDWELAAVTVWAFGLAGIALARAHAPAVRPLPRLARVVAGLSCLLLALAPYSLWRSQVRLQGAIAAFDARDCPRTVDAALDSLDAVGARAEPWELIAYCNVGAGRDALAVDAARAAVARDPGDWEYHYALALVSAAAGEDPRDAADEALRLNPMQPEAQEAVRAFETGGRRAWERRARRLPLYIR